MDADQLDFYKKLIEQHLKELEGEIIRLKELCRPISPDNAIGRLSRMEAIGERSIHQAALAKSEARKERLKDALHKIARDEDYGYCQICDEYIGEKRLKVLPESHVCVPCLQKMETD